MGVREYIILALGAALLISGAVAKFNYDQYHEFKTMVEVQGEQAQRDKMAKEAKWRKLFAQVEANYADDLKRHTDDFNTELTRLRNRSTSGTVRESPPTVGICTGTAENQRISAAVAEYQQRMDAVRLRLVEGFKSCQDNTDKLVACQAYVRAIMEVQ